MAGGLACLRQALPELTNAEILQLVRETASQYNSPDYLLGYGIANLADALSLELSNQNAERTSFSFYPNPISDKLFIRFPSDIESAQLYIHDLLGKLIVDIAIEPFAPVDLQSLSSGMYVVNIKSNNMSLTSYKLLKK